LVKNHRFLPDPPVYGTSVEGDSTGIFWHKKTNSTWIIIQRCSCDPMFSHFSRTPTCDRQTDRHKRVCVCAT